MFVCISIHCDHCMFICLLALSSACFIHPSACLFVCLLWSLRLARIFACYVLMFVHIFIRCDLCIFVCLLALTSTACLYICLLCPLHVRMSAWYDLHAHIFHIHCIHCDLCMFCICLLWPLQHVRIFPRKHHSLLVDSAQMECLSLQCIVLHFSAFFMCCVQLHACSSFWDSAVNFSVCISVPCMQVYVHLSILKCAIQCLVCECM